MTREFVLVVWNAPYYFSRSMNRFEAKKKKTIDEEGGDGNNKEQKATSN